MSRMLLLITIVILLTVGYGQQAQVNYTCGLPNAVKTSLGDPFWYKTLPKGETVAIVVENGIYKLALYDGGNLRTLYESPKGKAIFDLTVSPNGERFVLIESLTTESYPNDHKLLSIDLAGQVEILGQGVYDPLFSPDGRHLLYRRPLEEKPVLAVFDLVTGKERFLAPELTINTEFVEWSPDGQQIVVNPSFSTIYLVSLQTGNYEIFAEVGKAPAWSPNGSKIAFVRGGTIVLKDVSGENERIYTTPSEALLDIQWLDQNQLRFSSHKDGEVKQYLLYLTSDVVEQICQE